MYLHFGKPPCIAGCCFDVYVLFTWVHETSPSLQAHAFISRMVDSGATKLKVEIFQVMCPAGAAMASQGLMDLRHSFKCSFVFYNSIIFYIWFFLMHFCNMIILLFVYCDILPGCKVGQNCTLPGTKTQARWHWGLGSVCFPTLLRVANMKHVSYHFYWGKDTERSFRWAVRSLVLYFLAINWNINIYNHFWCFFLHAIWDWPCL